MTNDNTVQYYKFLQSKASVTEATGIAIPAGSLHRSTKPHQRDAVEWALRNGKGLIAASFGLGKTHIGIEVLRKIHEATGQRILIVCPLGVRTQFVNKDGPRLGANIQYVRTDAEVDAAVTPMLITNYERVRDGNIDPRKHQFAAVVLDEGNIMANLGTKTQQVFTALFADVPYRFVATATPAPNEYRELIYYAEFLGVMDHGQALTRFFKRNPEKAGDLQLHPQHEEEFWLWVASWALFLYTPSDLGYSDEGYALPELNVFWHRLPVDQTRAWDQHDNYGQGLLLLDPTMSATAAAKEKRATLESRIAKMLEIMAGESPDTHWLIWHDLEDERRAIEKAIPGVKTVYGSQDLDTNEANLLAFSDGEIPVLGVKPSMSGMGNNFQYHCHNAIFLGVNYKFRDIIQAVHRIYRFQQDKPVNVHFVHAESEDKVRDSLARKWEQHNQLQERMRAIQRQYGLSRAAISESLKRKVGVQRRTVEGRTFTLANNDCVLELASLPDNSVDLGLSSWPFSRHYEYTVQVEDFGHNKDDAAFFQQMEHLIPHLYRTLKPGRVWLVHAKDLVSYGHATKHGFMEIDPFSDMCVDAMRRHGFIFGGRRTITTDVVRENNSTYRLGYTEMTRDASKMGCGLPEYLLMFRKPPSSADTARADEPVTKNKAEYTVARWQIDAHSYWRSNGNTMVTREMYDYAAHVGRLADLEEAGNLPKTFFVEPPASNSDWVWDDINPMLCLNSQQNWRKVVNHICPLPFDIVERGITLYSNPGDLVLDPFLGIGTTAYCAIKLGRRAYGVELSPQYFEDAAYYCQRMEQQIMAPTLFDVLEMQESGQPQLEQAA